MITVSRELLISLGFHFQSVLSEQRTKEINLKEQLLRANALESLQKKIDNVLDYLSLLEEWKDYPVEKWESEVSRVKKTTDDGEDMWLTYENIGVDDWVSTRHPRFQNVKGKPSSEGYVRKKERAEIELAARQNEYKKLAETPISVEQVYYVDDGKKINECTELIEANMSDYFPAEVTEGLLKLASIGVVRLDVEGFAFAAEQVKPYTEASAFADVALEEKRRKDEQDEQERYERHLRHQREKQEIEARIAKEKAIKAEIEHFSKQVALLKQGYEITFRASQNKYALRRVFENYRKNYDVCTAASLDEMREQIIKRGLSNKPNKPILRK